LTLFRVNIVRAHNKSSSNIVAVQNKYSSNIVAVHSKSSSNIVAVHRKSSNNIVSAHLLLATGQRLVSILNYLRDCGTIRPADDYVCSTTCHHWNNVSYYEL